MFDRLVFHHEKISSSLLEISVSVPSAIAKELQEKAILAFKSKIKPHGLEKYDISPSFILNRYGPAINQTVRHFIFKNLVLDALTQELKTKKILIVHQPRLIQSSTADDNSILYTFRVSTLDMPQLGEWKKLPFKSPKRKLYKDLDKQVETFCEREGKAFDLEKKSCIEDGDWIELEATILDSNHKPIIDGVTQRYWFKFSITYITDSFKQQFFGKTVGDSFVTDQFHSSDQESESLSEQSPHKITILSISKGNHFSIDLFKSIFNLKSKLEIHKKLIEVFSFRNDISQRKSIIEEVFNLLLSKQRFEIPQHLTLRKQEDILKALRQFPDYHVYKAQKNFSRQLEKLAEKQLKEEVIIDSIAFKEGIAASRDDIKSYLHLFNHDRLREFVYFKPDLDRFDELDDPIPEQILSEAVVREKTLNNIIYQLSR
ncbi:hypothetical protein FJ366_02980 [Candidatus Dependentiae bacterium]|nr:hypothetical protein [Candidatus Dependentiae bacterium]